MNRFDENIGYYTTGDFNEDSVVVFEDFAIFLSAWLTEDGEVQYHSLCDIGVHDDYSIDQLDSKVFVHNWRIGLNIFFVDKCLYLKIGLTQFHLRVESV